MRFVKLGAVSLIIFGMAGSASPALAASSDNAAVLVPVRQFIAAFNKGDMKSAGLPYASEVAIIDEFAPYVWTGATGFQDWAADLTADSSKNGFTSARINLKHPQRVDVVGDRGYVVFPACIDVKVKDSTMVENGTMTFTLLSADQWKITGWSWAGGAIVLGKICK